MREGCRTPRQQHHPLRNQSDRRLTGAIQIYGGDFFGVERSEWDPETLQEGRYDVAKNMRLFEEANALYPNRVITLIRPTTFAVIATQSLSLTATLTRAARHAEGGTHAQSLQPCAQLFEPVGSAKSGLMPDIVRSNDAACPALPRHFARRTPARRDLVEYPGSRHG